MLVDSEQIKWMAADGLFFTVLVLVLAKHCLLPIAYERMSA